MTFEEWHVLLTTYHSVAAKHATCPHAVEHGHRRCPGWQAGSGIITCKVGDGRTGFDLTMSVLQNMRADGLLPLGMCGEECFTCFLILDELSSFAAFGDWMRAQSLEHQRVHSMITDLVLGRL